MENNQEKQDAGKIEKNYKSAMRKLTAVIGGEGLYKPTKLVPDEVRVAMEELAKEEKEETIRLIKEKASKLIKDKRDFDKFAKQQLKEMADKIANKQKEFTKDANDLFSMIEGIGNIEKSYYEVLGAAEAGDLSPEETSAEEQTTSSEDDK